jgi:hypothetical protein
MHPKSDRKTRGHTSITGVNPVNPTNPHVPQEARREATRPVSSGSGKHRGDRRDTSRLYTGNDRHSSRGNTPRADVKTRKR